MAGSTGLDTQFGIAEEVTYGTYIAPTRFILALNEGLALNMNTVQSAGIGSGQRFIRTDQWLRGKRQAAGALNTEIAGKGYGVFFKHMLGAVATTADGTGKKHTFTWGALAGKSLSIQVGKPDVGNVVDPFTYLGCKIPKWTLKQQVEGFLEATFDIDARDETVSQTLGAVSVPTAERFNWNQLAVTVGGVAFNPLDVEIAGDTPMKTDRFFLAASNLKKEPLENGMRHVTGKLTGEFESLVAYNRFINGNVVPIIFTWTGATTYDVGKFYKLVITLNNCRFDGTTPTVKGPDVVDQELPFEALDDGSLAVVQFDYFSSDATP